MPRGRLKPVDPRWKYGWWLDPAKEFVQCIFCKKIVPLGVKSFSSALLGVMRMLRNAQKHLS